MVVSCVPDGNPAEWKSPIDKARFVDNEGTALPQGLIEDSGRCPPVMILTSTLGSGGAVFLFLPSCVEIRFPRRISISLYFTGCKRYCEKAPKACRGARSGLSKRQTRVSEQLRRAWAQYR